MRFLPNLVPQTLVGRVFALYAVSLALFVGVGLGFFYYYTFVVELEDAADSAQILSEVVAQTVADSVVIGDYDTVKRTLHKAIKGSPFADASFIDLQGGTVTETQPARAGRPPPRWLIAQVASRMQDINNVIAVGGRDYGVLRLRFSPEITASQIWKVTSISLGAAVAALLLGLFLFHFLLRRWLGGLDRIREADRRGGDAVLDGGDALTRGAPREIRDAIDAFRRTGAELRVQRETAAVTLNAIADGVITTDSQGRILYVNPAAERVLQSDSTILLQRFLWQVLPAAFDDRGTADPFAAWSGRRIELATAAGSAIVLDTTFSPIVSSAGKTIGHVLAWRDVTQAQQYEDRLRTELETRQAALHDLRDALTGMVPEASRDQFAISDNDLGAVSRLVAQLVRDREASRRALDNQMRALDEHAGVTIADADFNFTYANQKFSELAGEPVDAIIGQNHYARSIENGLQPPEYYRKLFETIASGKVWQGEIVARRKDGQPYWLTTTIMPWLGDSGQPAQYIAIRTDITPQRKVERELAEARLRELETGHEIQRALLIGDLPMEARIAEVASYTEPSQGIDGDFFAFTTFRSNCLELLVGDVMGKGVPAALIGAAVRTAYNQVVSELLAASFGSRELPSPAEVMNALHRKLTPRLIELEAFVTMALYRFDFDYGSGTMRYVNAGHTAGLLVRADGGIDRVVGENVPLGVLTEERYVERAEVVGADDALIVYSDGITEARNAQGIEFGEERLLDFIDRTNGVGLPPSIRMQALRRAVREFAGDRGMQDDQTAVMVSLRPQGFEGYPGQDVQGRTEVLDVPWDTSRLELLRARVRAAALPFGNDAADGLVLGAFEAATNVIRHVVRPFPDATVSFRIIREAAAVTVEIWYLGEPFQPPAQLQPDFSGDSEGGFGLYIISQAVGSVAYENPLPGVCCTRIVRTAEDSATA